MTSSLGRKVAPRNFLPQQTPQKPVREIHKPVDDKQRAKESEKKTHGHEDAPCLGVPPQRKWAEADEAEADSRSKRDGKSPIRGNAERTEYGHDRRKDE